MTCVNHALIHLLTAHLATNLIFCIIILVVLNAWSTTSKKIQSANPAKVLAQLALNWMHANHAVLYFHIFILATVITCAQVGHIRPVLTTAQNVMLVV